jgi:hypothetical protein
MATVSKETAMELVKYKGKYPGDPKAFAVIEFANQFGTQYAICYTEAEYYRITGEVGLFKTLWVDKSKFFG